MLDNARRLIICIWVRAISAAESQLLSRFLFCFFLVLSLPFYSYYISHQSRRHQCLFRRLATADTTIIFVVFHILFPSFLSVTYITPIIGGFDNSSPRPALPSFASSFVASSSCALHISQQLWVASPTTRHGQHYHHLCRLSFSLSLTIIK
jgi:hypothetical protein